MEVELQKNGFEETFHKHVDSKNLLTVSQGAQFGIPGGALLFLIMMGMLVFAVFFCVQGNLPAAVGLFVAIVLLLGFIVDVRGFQIDFERGQIRTYKSYLGSKSGNWFPLEDFSTIELYQDKFTERKSIYGRAGMNGDNDTSYFYFVSMTDTKNDRRVLVYESDSYVVSYVFAKKMSERTGLPANLNVKPGESEYFGGM